MKDSTKVLVMLIALFLAGAAVGWTINDWTTQLYCWEDYAAKMSRCITVP